MNQIPEFRRVRQQFRQDAGSISEKRMVEISFRIIRIHRHIYDLGFDEVQEKMRSI